MLEEFATCVPLTPLAILNRLSEDLDDLLEECREISAEIKALRAELDAEL
jgi:restriction endonuclease S subunit